MNDYYASLIPKGIQNQLDQLAQSQSRNNWKYGDVANSMMRLFRVRQAAGEQLANNTPDYTMWNAIGHYAQLSGGRIQKIAKVAAIFKPGSRARWEYSVKYSLSFGYFEEVIQLPPEDWLICLDFVVECEQDERLLGRRPNVGEFVTMYRQHIKGEKVFSYGEKPPLVTTIAPDSHQRDGERFYSPTPNYAIQAFLETKNGVKRFLFGHQDKPKVREFMAALEVVERLAPEVMEVIGIMEKESV